MRRIICLSLALAFATDFQAKASAQQTLTESRFEELLEQVVPAEATTQIDWLPDLIAGQNAAVEQKKPMFIWSMDGHPLGCT